MISSIYFFYNVGGNVRLICFDLNKEEVDEIGLTHAITLSSFFLLVVTASDNFLVYMKSVHVTSSAVRVEEVKKQCNIKLEIDPLCLLFLQEFCQLQKWYEGFFVSSNKELGYSYCMLKNWSFIFFKMIVSVRKTTYRLLRFQIFYWFFHFFSLTLQRPAEVRF